MAIAVLESEKLYKRTRRWTAEKMLDRDIDVPSVNALTHCLLGYQFLSQEAEAILCEIYGLEPEHLYMSMGDPRVSDKEISKEIKNGSKAG